MVEAIVDVVIPTYRRSDLLRQTVVSALAQSEPRMRVWVVNDCPEEADAVDRALAGTGDRVVHVLHTPVSSGACKARNLGFAAGRAPFVAFLDDDDVWLPTFLERHLAVHAKTVVQSFVASDHFNQWENLAWARQRVQYDRIRWAEEGMGPPTSCLTFRRETIEAIGGFITDLAGLQDWDLKFRALERGPCRHIREPLTIMREHRSQRTSTVDNLAIGRTQILAMLEGRYDPQVVAHADAYMTWRVRRRHIRRLALAFDVRGLVPELRRAFASSSREGLGLIALVLGAMTVGERGLFLARMVINRIRPTTDPNPGARLDTH